MNCLPHNDPRASQHSPSKAFEAPSWSDYTTPERFLDYNLQPLYNFLETARDSLSNEDFSSAHMWVKEAFKFCKKPNDQALCLEMRASIHTATGNLLRALSDLLQAMETQPHSWLTRHHLLCDLGDVLNKMGRFDEALGYLKRAVKTDPNNEFAYSYLGESHLNLGQFKKAAEAFLAGCHAAEGVLPGISALEDFVAEHPEILESDPQLKTEIEEVLAWVQKAERRRAREQEEEAS